MKINGNQSSIAWASSNVLLCILPARHKSEPELKFWCSVARHAKEQGLEFVHVGTEPLPSAHATSIVLQREPTRLDRMLHISPELPIAWISEEFLKVILESEYLRGQAMERSLAAYRGLVRLANLVEYTICALRPRWVITWGKGVHICALFNRLAHHNDIPSLVIARAPINDRLWAEPRGLHGESVLWDHYVHRDDRGMAALGDQIRTGLSNNVYGFRKPTTLGKGGVDLDRASGRPVFFLPMDSVFDGAWLPRQHPLSKQRYPLYDDPREALEELGRTVQAIGGRLIVKKHPVGRFIRPEIMPGNVELVDGDLAKLLHLADVVVCFCTKVAFPALALGKPVVTLSPNIAACSGATYHCLRREDVESTLRSAHSRIDLETRLQRVSPFLGWLASDFFYACDDSLANSGKGPREFVSDLLSLDTASPEVRTMSRSGLSRAVDEIERMAHCIQGRRGKWNRGIKRVWSGFGGLVSILGKVRRYSSETRVR